MLYLLERLAAAAEATPGPPPRDDLRAAVRLQIERVVSSHFWPGAPGLQLMGLNLPPVAGYGYAAKGDIESYCASLRDLVTRQEPRLTGVRIELAATGSPLMPYQLAVTGRLRDGNAAGECFRFELPQRG